MRNRAFILPVGFHVTWGTRAANYLVIGYGGPAHVYELTHRGVHVPDAPPQQGGASYVGEFDIIPDENPIVWSPGMGRWIDARLHAYMPGDRVTGAASGLFYQVVDYATLEDNLEPTYVVWSNGRITVVPERNLAPVSLVGGDVQAPDDEEADLS